MGKSRQRLRKRIRGVRETAKVTHAMEVVAGARMRRMEERAFEARPYAEGLGELIGVVLDEGGLRREHPLLIDHEADSMLVIHMTTDKGLCGALNTRLNQSLGRYALEHRQAVKIVTVGRKGRDFVVRTGLDLVADFSGLGDALPMSELRPLCRLAIDMFSSGAVGPVYLSYPRFVSTTVQQPSFERLLPIEVGHRRTTGSRFLIEPEPEALLEALLERYIEAHIYRAHLERVASEYSARMVAMHNATDSARELGEDLTLELNKARQAAVTSELSDVSAGTEGLAAGGASG